jgi:hypothetical protein
MHARTRLLAITLLSCALLSFTTHVAFAQREEPRPPGSDSDNEAPPPPPRANGPRERSTEPAVVTTDPVTGADTTRPSKKFYPLDWVNGIGVYAHYLFATAAMIHPYEVHATGLNSFDVGLQYIRRYTHFDVVTSLDFSWFVLNSGNWLTKGDDPSLDTHFTQFDKLSLLSADVSIIGHYAFNDWLELRGGAGLGLGVVFGGVLTTNDSNTVCTKENAGSTKNCFPISPAVGPIILNQPGTNALLQRTQDSSRDDTAQNPHRKRTTIPVMGVLNVMMALNFRVMKQLSTQVEIGFRDAMFVGAAVQYHF